VALLQKTSRRGSPGELPTYQVLVQSRNLGMFGNDPEVLKAHSYLMLKSSKEKLTPQNVVIQKGQNEKVAAIIYEFARSQQWRTDHRSERKGR